MVENSAIFRMQLWWSLTKNLTLDVTLILTKYYVICKLVFHEKSFVAHAVSITGGILYIFLVS